jgi:hypothetical protein
MSAAGRLPDFVILGAQKAGTTSLAAWLSRHHACWIAPEKEVHYFDLGLAKGEPWYRSRFAGAPWRARAGEATPYYLFHPRCAERIARTLPAARLVVVLRDPVERAISGYFHSVRFGKEPLAVGQAMDAEAARLAEDDALEARDPGAYLEHRQWRSYQARGDYASQLARYHEAGCADRIHVLFFEELVATPVPVLDALCAHLGVARATHPLERANAGIGARDGLDDVRTRLRHRFEEPDARLAAMLGRALPWRS